VCLETMVGLSWCRTCFLFELHGILQRAGECSFERQDWLRSSAEISSINKLPCFMLQQMLKGLVEDIGLAIYTGASKLQVLRLA
jgi:hypothetical protein